MGPLPSPILESASRSPHLSAIQHGSYSFEHLIGWNQQSGLWCLTWARSGSGPQLLLNPSNVWTF